MNAEITQEESAFIVIEGLDGSGKTSVGRLLMQYLETAFPGRIKLTFEPHDPSCGGLYIRQVLTKRIKRFSHRTLALSFAANRLDHCDREINPWLEKEGLRLCISDRYYLSSLVYQSVENLPMAAVMQLNELARKPDLIFFLNVSNEVCLQRMQIRNQPAELFEQNLSETRNKFYQAISFLEKEQAAQIVEIDGNGTLAHTLSQMLAILFERWPAWKSDELPSVEAFFANGSKQEPSNRWQEPLADYFRNLGYKIVASNEIPEALLYDLRFDLPGGLSQRGLGILLRNPQRIDVLFSRLLKKVEQVDFIFLFSPGPAETVNHYYERDMLTIGTERKLFPTVKILTQEDLVSRQ